MALTHKNKCKRRRKLFAQQRPVRTVADPAIDQLNEWELDEIEVQEISRRSWLAWLFTMIRVAKVW